MADRFRCGRCGATFDELDDLTQARVLSRGCPFCSGAVFPLVRSAWPFLLLILAAWLAVGAFLLFGFWVAGAGPFASSSPAPQAEANR